MAVPAEENGCQNNVRPAKKNKHRATVEDASLCVMHTNTPCFVPSVSRRYVGASTANPQPTSSECDCTIPTTAMTHKPAPY